MVDIKLYATSTHSDEAINTIYAPLIRNPFCENFHELDSTRKRKI